VRINRDEVRELVGFFGRLFMKKKMKKKLAQLSDALDIYDGLRSMNTRVDFAVSRKKGITLSAEETLTLQKFGDSIRSISL